MRWLNSNFVFPWLPLAAVLLVVWLVAGCTKTTYFLQRCEGEGADKVCVEGRAETRRKFESFEFTGNFQTGELSLKGSKVSTEFSPLEHSAARLLDRIDPTRVLPQVPE